ncbi:HMG box protein [Alternaria alternata]|nr:HMG box protein [Alternaria alternata]
MQASRPRAANTVRGRKSRTLVRSNLNRPLSDHSDDVTEAAAKRTQEWVNRPADVRWRETKQRDGHIARPPNSFMLYRSAYIPEAKARYSQHKQQNLSAIVSCSWHMESQKVRQAYQAYAVIERSNHQKAYPRYKFSPKKPATRKGVTSSEERPETISGGAYSRGDCALAVAADKDQAWHTAPCPIDTDDPVRSTAPGAFAAWLSPQPTLWQDKYGSQAIHHQGAENNVLWPGVMTTPLFLERRSVSCEPPMDTMAFPTVPNINGLPVVSPSWSGAERCWRGPPSTTRCLSMIQAVVATCIP